MASSLEAAGFDSLWVSDHVAMPMTIRSHYPFADDGRAPWSGDIPYIEAVVALAIAASATRHVRLGTAVLVLPQRNPVLLAKQIASIDVISGGRVELGVGAGWLREEFEALDSPFAERGARLEEWMEIMRAYWTGRPEPRAGLYAVPREMVQLPTPAHDIPLLVGGHSGAALRRAGSVGDGWLAQQSIRNLDFSALSAGIAAVRASADREQRQAKELRFILRLVDSARLVDQVASQAAKIAAVGITEVIVDVPEGGSAALVYDTLRDAAG